MEMGGGITTDNSYAHLEMLTGPLANQTIYVDRHRFSIGRYKDAGVNCDFPMLDNISRLHCRIIFNNNSFVIEDMGSSNGTYVNGMKLQPHTPISLPNGAEVKLGTKEESAVKFRFIALKGADAASTKRSGTTQLEHTLTESNLTQYEGSLAYPQSPSAWSQRVSAQSMASLPSTNIYNEPDMPSVDVWPGTQRQTPPQPAYGNAYPPSYQQPYAQYPPQYGQGETEYQNYPPAPSAQPYGVGNPPPNYPDLTEQVDNFNFDSATNDEDWNPKASPDWDKKI